MEDTEGEVVDSFRWERRSGEGRGTHSARFAMPRRATPRLCARVLIPEGSETRTCLEHRRPPATCTSLPGRALAAWENTSKLPGTRSSLSPPLSFSLSLSLSLSTDNSSRCAPASSTSLIRLRILRVATIFSRTCFDLVVVYGNKISFRRVTVVNFVLWTFLREYDIHYTEFKLLGLFKILNNRPLLYITSWIIFSYSARSIVEIQRILLSVVQTFHEWRIFHRNNYSPSTRLPVDGRPCTGITR